MQSAEEIERTLSDHGKRITDVERVLNAHALSLQAMEHADKRLQEIMGDIKLGVVDVRQDIKNLTAQALSSTPPEAVRQLASQGRQIGTLVALLGTAVLALATLAVVLFAH